MNPQIETLLDSLRAQVTCLQIIPSLRGASILLSDIDTLKRLIADSDASKTMSVRDTFAAQALVALPHIGCGADLETGEIAEAAYQIADAMMAVRAKQPS